MENDLDGITPVAEVEIAELTSLLSKASNALEPFARRAELHLEEHEIALSVGGYVPLDDDFPIEIDFGPCECARAVLADIKAATEKAAE